MRKRSANLTLSHTRRRPKHECASSTNTKQVDQVSKLENRSRHVHYELTFCLFCIEGDPRNLKTQKEIYCQDVK